MATYEDTNRSGRKICTMRYLGSVAMGKLPGVLTCRAEKGPIMANQLGRAPRRQCRLGYFPGRVDRPLDGKKINVRETPARSAALCESPRILSRRYFATLAGRRPTGEEIAGRRCYPRAVGVGVSSGGKTDHGEPMRPRAT